MIYAQKFLFINIRYGKMEDKREKNSRDLPPVKLHQRMQIHMIFNVRIKEINSRLSYGVNEFILILTIFKDYLIKPCFEFETAFFKYAL